MEGSCFVLKCSYTGRGERCWEESRNPARLGYSCLWYRHPLHLLVRMGDWQKSQYFGFCQTHEFTHRSAHIFYYLSSWGSFLSLIFHQLYIHFPFHSNLFSPHCSVTVDWFFLPRYCNVKVIWHNPFGPQHFCASFPYLGGTSASPPV